MYVYFVTTMQHRFTLKLARKDFGVFCSHLTYYGQEMRNIAYMTFLSGALCYIMKDNI